MNRGYDIVRSGAWLTRERLRLLAVAILGVSLVAVVCLLVTATGLIDMQGRPLGTDSSGIYTAGTHVMLVLVLRRSTFSFALPVAFSGRFLLK